MEENSQKQALIHERKAYKTLLRNPQVFCRFMRSLVNEELAQKVAPENIEMVDKSYITKEGRKYESDLIYKVLIEPEAYFLYFNGVSIAPGSFDGTADTQLYCPVL